MWRVTTGASRDDSANPLHLPSTPRTLSWRFGCSLVHGMNTIRSNVGHGAWTVRSAQVCYADTDPIRSALTAQHRHNLRQFHDSRICSCSRSCSLRNLTCSEVRCPSLSRSAKDSHAIPRAHSLATLQTPRLHLSPSSRLRSMSFETGVAWYDALPGLDLTRCDTPSDHWRRLFWSAQIAKTRGAARPGHVASLHVLACTLLTGYRCGLGPECLSECLCLLRDLHGRGLGLARWTLDFGEALFAEHEHIGAIEPIEEMVRVHEEAPTTGTLGLDIRCQLAKALIARGSFTGEDADLSRAKCILDAIGPLIEEGSSPHFAVVSAMRHVAFNRAYKECALEDMRSLANTLQGHLQCTDRRMQRYQMDLQAAYFAISAIICYEAECLEEFEHCVQIADAALLSLPHKSFAATIALSEFCMWFEEYSSVGKRRYVQHSRQLVEWLLHVAKGNSIHMSEAHHTLGRWMYGSRGWASNEHTNSLEISATHHRQALVSCPPHHVYRNKYLTGLSCSLGCLYDSNGARTALNEVIALFERYTDVARRVPAFAINVSSAMVLRATSGRLRMDSKQSLAQRAIEALQNAILGTPPSSSHYKWLLYSLGNAYLYQLSWGCSVNRADHLDIARRAVAAAVGGPALTLSQMELGLARVLINNARQTHDAALLHEAVALLESISKRRLVGDTFNLDGQIAWLRATAYMIRYRLLGISEDLQIAQAMFQSLCSGWGYVSLNMRRLELVLAWADAAHYAEQDATEMCAYQHMVGFLSQLACLGEEVATRVEALQLAEGLACRAAAIFLTCGDIHGAIELLEQSRGVVWTQTLRLKAPISSVPPDYADEFSRIAGVLKQPSVDTSDAIKRRDSASELDGLLERIRQVEGYERFLLPRLHTELATCTSHGFVVLAIPSDACTDILIMRSAEVTPTHLRLPSIQVQRLQDWTAELKRSCDQSRDAVSGDRMGIKLSTSSVLPARDEAYMKLLRELWLEIVQPVLASLGIEVRARPGFSRY
jgi:hypothetical protein